jgi:HD-GYP domain-containing protein (c-di-GMP phosphodiesterase class II)
LDWPEKPLNSLARGAYLHDIGKLGIPDGILPKPGPLTEHERKLMQQHVQIGFDVIKDIPFLADAAEIILLHHERYDGGGYPNGLRGTQIHLGARIFTIADAFDAITSGRPYRLASSFESARDTIRRGSGSQFDPLLVDTLLNIREDIWPVIARNEPQFAGLPAQFVANPATLRLRRGFHPD